MSILEILIAQRLLVITKYIYGEGENNLCVQIFEATAERR